jgi:hypothetical protein
MTLSQPYYERIVEVLKQTGRHAVPTSNDPMAAVCQYIDAFNKGDAEAMARICADPELPGQLLRGITQQHQKGQHRLRQPGVRCPPV